MRPDDTTGQTYSPRRDSVPTRVAFLFDGDLDDVPTDAVAALAGVGGALLKHAGRAATVPVARLGSLLNLWLTDPGCSPTSHYGCVARRIRLSEGATGADVTASCKDGILEVRVPAPKAAIGAASIEIPVAAADTAALPAHEVPQRRGEDHRVVLSRGRPRPRRHVGRGRPGHG